MDLSIQPPTYEEATEAGLLQRRRPSLHMKDVVERYMTKHRNNGLDGSIHPALNTNTSAVRYNAERARWMPSEEVTAIIEPAVARPASPLDLDRHKWKSNENSPDPNFKSMFKNVEKDELDFRNAVAAFERDAKPEYKVGIDLTITRSIGDVISAVEKAQKEYELKAERGRFSPFRKVLRKIGDHHKSYQSYLTLAPSQSAYFSLVCGGVVLLLEAAGRLREINSQILNALANIPMLVDKSQRLLAAYSTSEDLQQHCAKLYVAVLQTLGDMLQFYRERAVRKAIKVVFTQSSFKSALVDRITILQRCEEAINSESATCDTETGVDTNRNVREASEIMKATYEYQGKLYEETLEQRRELVRQRQENAELRAEVKAMAISTSASASALQWIQEHFMAHPELNEISETDPAPRLNQEHVTLSPSKDQVIVKKASLATKKKIAKELGYQSRVNLSDRKYNLEQIMSFTRADQNRTVYVMQSAKLQKWLNANCPSVILINGGMSGAHNLRTPISFVSAKLADALHQSRKSGLKSAIINLQFFCGEHEDWRENIDNGPAAVWNSLIAQLLLQYDHFDLADVKRLSQLDNDDVKALGIAFGNLLKQLPLGFMVFCIVDSVSLYDDEERGDDTELLVKKLVALTRKSAAADGCVFKLMLTSHTQLRLEAVESLRNKEILQVPEILESGDGFSDLKWDRFVGKRIDSLQTS
ncbi:hypothetical protein T440DRAFT_161170 [Plenodomus tracheiphilus IPT5]|uniref:DUF7708 domain-containing protein n=1 Tax=Plenodomus tracheiphilus IPT5 TaxID=1408161 RepID=A0A6A7BMF5_9PLEO|nr:hypothetical protein T440DRAFT_161170 [Plenodomus tracheiphilus IPT5]